MPEKDKDQGYEPDRRNGQGEHEGKAHSPSEFDVMNPAKTKDKPNDDVQEQL
ncbi:MULTISPECIES: hypothetical protein [Paracoccus]|uniref:Uncharacterized protein n=1 Tax=Paracoccus fontiphilus TaxID=1815556 RepID=A0ABV7IGY9_9RHOB|nr:hypothetical protein [Paracoccus fontiphilus]